MAEPDLGLIQSMLQTLVHDSRLQARRTEEVIARLGRIEVAVAGLHADFASLSVRIDRLDERLTRLEARSGLSDA